ncbi:MAG: DUF2270 domain-containing protein [Pyrinomonadaceae bacterium]|nr:DUF2270 domain-containing protein [Pyrinomonadaceae bacterium]
MSTDARSRLSGSSSDGRRDSGSLRRTTNTSTAESLKTERPPNTVETLPRTLSSSEFNMALVHFYRGEVQRSNTWRNRLDTTTNWAVLTAGATLSFAFSAPQNPHFVILINSLLVAFFLFMEARRYRYYEIWSSRVRVLETGYFAQMLHPETAPDKDWAEHLADDLLTPRFTISEWEAVGRRLRRNYLWIFALLAASWNLKVYMHPNPALYFDEFLARAAVGLVPGKIIFSIGVLFNTALLVFALATVRLREATGEVLPRHEFSFRTLRRVTDWTRAHTVRRSSTTLRRAKRARARVRTTASSSTGEWKKPDTSEWQRAEQKEHETEKTLG